MVTPAPALFKRLSGEDRTGFFRLSRPGIARLLTQVAQGHMRDSDLRVLLALGQGASNAYGTVQAGIPALQRATGLSRATVVQSLHRLERERLVLRPGSRRGWQARLKALSPEIVCSGQPDRIESHWRFWEAVVREAQPPPPPSPSAIRARQAKPVDPAA